MIDKLKYDDILAISNELKKEIQVVQQMTSARKITQLSDFIATVEGYAKFLVNIVEVNKDADLALADLRAQIKGI